VERLHALQSLTPPGHSTSVARLVCPYHNPHHLISANRQGFNTSRFYRVRCAVQIITMQPPGPFRPLPAIQLPSSPR
jgi:hypothetical protein